MKGAEGGMRMEGRGGNRRKRRGNEKSIRLISLFEWFCLFFINIIIVQCRDAAC